VIALKPHPDLLSGSTIEDSLDLLKRKTRENIGMLAMVSTIDALFCTFTKSGGCSAAEQLEVLFTARLSSSSFINSGKTLSDIFTIRFRIRGSMELFMRL
jgi:hypothetical protein